MAKKSSSRFVWKFGSIDRALKKYTYNVMLNNNVDDMAMLHGYILHFLVKREGQDVFQKDIEKEMKIAKSYVTGILKVFEEKGWIIRTSMKDDARLKKITLTEAGKKLDDDMRSSFDEVEKAIIQSLTNDEVNQLFNLLDKIENKLKEGINA